MMPLIVVSRLVLAGALIFAVLIGTVPSVATTVDAAKRSSCLLAKGTARH